MKNIFKAKKHHEIKSINGEKVLVKNDCEQSFNFLHKQHHFKIDVFEGTPSLSRIIQMCNFMIDKGFKRYQMTEESKKIDFIVWRV